MGRGKAVAADAVAGKPQSRRQPERRYRSGQSNGETTTGSTTSDDVKKREPPEPCDVEHIKIEVEGD